MIANARMYSINAATARAWRTLLEWVLACAGADAEVIDFPAPQPLSELWARADLACAFMCGYPYALATPRPVLLAAPVPAMEGCGGEPIYWTDIVVRADSPVRGLADLIGRRFAWTAPDSQSGFQAPRCLLAPLAREHGGRLFAATLGPLVTPRRVVDAVVAGDADAGPLDSYVHALLQAGEPALAAQLRVIATTEPTPIPPLIAATGIPAVLASRLTEALLAVDRAEGLAPVLATLRLERFARVPPERYNALLTRARDADALGYLRLH